MIIIGLVYILSAFSRRPGKVFFKRTKQPIGQMYRDLNLFRPDITEIIPGMIPVEYVLLGVYAIGVSIETPSHTS
jgi:hypothetical protein